MMHFKIGEKKLITLSLINEKGSEYINEIIKYWEKVGAI